MTNINEKDQPSLTIASFEHVHHIVSSIHTMAYMHGIYAIYFQDGGELEYFLYIYII